MVSPRVLLVRFSAIGDCTMSAYAATAIRTKYPDAKISWAVERRCADVLESNRLLDRVVVFDRDKSHPAVSIWRDMLRGFAQLRSSNYDWGIDLQGHGKTALALRFARPKARISVPSSDPFARRLNPQKQSRERFMHKIEVESALINTFEEFEIPALPIMPQVALPSPIAELNRKPIVIAVGAGQPWKTWPISKWELLGAELVKQGLPVVFIGGKEDIVPVCPGSISLVGKLRLSESMGVIARAQCVICGDTGAGHLGAAYGIPTISLFGPTSPKVYRPYGPLARVIQQGSSLEAISMEEVTQAEMEITQGFALQL